MNALKKAAGLCLLVAGAAQASPSFVTSAGWQNSSVAGLQPEKNTYWTTQPGATATWRPAFSGPVRAQVWFYKIVHQQNGDPKVHLEIAHSGQIATQFVTCAEGSSAWVALGAYDFAGGDAEFVRLTKVSRGVPTRIGAVRFDLLNDSHPPAVIQSFTLDDVTGGPLVQSTETMHLRTHTRSDLKAGPPDSKAWKLVFHDEFNGPELDRQVWQAESGSPGHILSSRWPENVVVTNGLLRLLTKKEDRGGKPWTTGNIWTKTYQAKYGYFEARMRIAKASGLNNAFWLMTTNKPGDPIHFEIDITEAHYPNIHTMTLHNWAGKHTATGTRFTTEEDLSSDFHLYALEWNAHELIWYLDGQVVRRCNNTFCQAASPLRLSSAVGRWAGRISDALDGTSMDVDWVRVYQRAEPGTPSAPGIAGEWRQSLDGPWQFSTNETAAVWDAITVPGNWDALPAYATYRGKGWYQRTFAAPPEWKDRHIRLRFDAVYHDALVTLNGRELGRHIGGYTPFEFDVTDRLNFNGTNNITVCADNTFRRGAWWHWGGISRSVTLIANRDARIVRQHIRAEPDLAAGTATLFLRCTLANAGEKMLALRLASAVEGVDEPALSQAVTLAPHTEQLVEARTTLPKERVRLWHFDQPNLYRLTTRIMLDGIVLHERADRFGIRKIDVTPDGLLFNGERVRLCGFNRVSDSREAGNTEPDALVQQDVDLMKRCGANLTRLMHYPQAPHLLDYLDEKGMLIFEEIPVWGGATDPNMKPDNPVTQQWLREMIERDYNHPCVIGWSVGNELLQHDAYVKSMIAYVRRELDPHRLLTYVSYSGARKDYGPLNDPISACDILLHNTYGAAPGKMAEMLRAKWPQLPIFFSEFGSRQFGATSDATIPGLIERWSDLANHPYVIGVSLWTFNDYRSDYPGTPPSGNREWGVVDMRRQPKAAYEQIRQLFNPVHALTVSNHTVRLEPRGANELPSYTLHGYQIRWTLPGGPSGTLAVPDLKPGDASWTMPLPVPGSHLVVELVTPTGYVVNEYRETP